MSIAAERNAEPSLLVVDDEPSALKATCRVLARAGYTVWQATDAAQAMELIRARRPSLVLLDLVLPGRSGIDVLNEIRDDPDLESVSVVLLSSVKTDPEAQAKGLDHLADGYIARPVGNRELLARVRAHLRHRELVDQLRESELSLRRILINQADGTLVVDEAGKIVFHNPAAERIFSKTPQELAGAEFGYPISGPGSTEIHVYCPGGEIRTAEMRVTEILWEDRPAWVASVRDVTRRKIREELLNLKNAALEAAANAIIITDRDGTIEWINPAFSSASGYSLEECVGRKPGDLIQSGHHDSAFYKDLWEIITSGKVWHGQIVNRRRDGVLRTEEMTIAPVKDPNGRITHFIAIKQDISERLQLEEQLRHSQRMESIGQLTGGIAHDFNNLLTVILGNSELLLDELPENSSMADSVDMVIKSATRGADLTRRLLAFARKQPLDPKTVDINQLITHMERLLGSTLGESIEINITKRESLWPALIDPGQLEDALLNLAINARDAMPDGGNLTIQTENIVLGDEHNVFSSDAEPGNYTLIAVADTGCGIPNENLEKIFEPFYSTKKTGLNSGLGLAMVYGFIKQSGGHVRVHSEPGRGTTVKMYLPASNEAGKLAELQQGQSKHHRGDETILVVEDDPMLSQSARNQLELLGYTVITALSGHEALDVIRSGQEIHLLFTDVVMPGGINGRQLADQALKLRPNLSVLFTSSYTENAIVHNGILDEDVHFLFKPYRRKELAEKVRQALTHARRQP